MERKCSDRNLVQFFKDWMLVISMVFGASLYLIYHAIPAIHTAGPTLEAICKKLQPTLLFIMLFLSFSKVSPKDFRIHRWQLWELLAQSLLFIALAGVIIIAVKYPQRAVSEWIIDNRFPLEAAMLCLICPTATACAVVTDKLGGSIPGVMTYTVLINLVVAILVPLIIPLIYPIAGMTFTAAFFKILHKVFPLLILPWISAWLLRWLFPKAHKWVVSKAHWSFYIWAVGLTLAILMSTRAIVHDNNGLRLMLGIAAASLITCIFQFWLGHRIGSKYSDPITAGQALGQKNTVFSIWMGYTFLNPIVSIAGGFYSIWHNLYNSYQIHQHRLQTEKK